MTPTLAIVIVNYRTAKLTADCLRSIAADPQAPAVHVVVADNNSGDDSAPTLRAAINSLKGRLCVDFLPLTANLGFAGGNNAGLRRLLAAPESPALVLLLNPDTLVKPGALDHAVRFMASTPACGIVGLSLEDETGAPQRAAHAMISPLRELARGASLGFLWRMLKMNIPAADSPFRCDWVSGAALCVRTEALKAVGAMDDGFFLYFEEVDLCKRVSRAGWEVWSLPDARIVHMEGSSTGIAQRARRRPGYWFDSRRRFFVKHYGSFGLIAADLLWGVGRLTFEARRVLRLVPPGQPLPERFWRDLIVGDLGALWRGSILANPRSAPVTARA